MGINWYTQVQYLKGVGPKLGSILERKGYDTVGKLLYNFPRTYEDQRAMLELSKLVPDQIVTLRTHIQKVSSFNMGRSKRKIYEVMVGDSTGKVKCKFFRVPYRGYFQRFQPLQLVRISGKVTNYRGSIEFHHPTIDPITDDETMEDELIPLYSETEGLTSAKMRRLIQVALFHLTDKKNFTEHCFPDSLPDWLEKKYQLMSKQEALKEIHHPPLDVAEPLTFFRSPAQKRIIFEEFFWLELYLASKKTGFKNQTSPKMITNPKWTSQFLNSLPFELTGAQKIAFQEIHKDIAKSQPMHRLVQGDVGSGKTLVALLAALVAVESGYQVSFMVPTEILAEQHYKNSLKFFENLPVKIGLLTGKQKTKEKNDNLEKITSGEFDLCIGTHALMQKDVSYKNLGLVIVDEQHRFGVNQRKELRSKGQAPHFLVMTATPIPRTLAMTAYGDLDVSIINELPKGRQVITTKKALANKRDKVYGFMLDQVKKGRQVYIVYPLVEESEKMDLKDAVSEFEKLKNLFPDTRFGLLHGKMKSDEKENTMGLFRDHKIDVLVSTTVIEVGVDVPNANLMIIEHSERFGLSQLHQLRGRVGRGAHKSYCVLMLGYAQSDEARMRAEVMEQNSDGFKVSEYDLEMRGAGEFLGTKQSGLPGFKMANLVRDLEILKLAREAAFDVFEKDPKLKKEEHKALLKTLYENHKDIVG
ncbi:MAG: ATP-dependent DNA helicase RecG [Bdellovibrionaceae bacterium]|jgi:ATP-dependent DNA helicase RecG|nr:ATP-dependent DNA helicase RecG [Pseudobdellovibrionaceae bacterium]